MAQIHCLDLKRQHQKIKAEIFEAFEKVYENTAFSGGPFVEKFENEFANFCDTEYAIGVNNGTTALHLAMLALGIGAGDEVIVPANTFIATAWGVSHAGATPVFVDCTADTWEIDPTKIEAAITPKTKAIVPVHLYGHAADMEAIMSIAKKHNLFVIEDNAQAIGNDYRFSDGTVKKTGSIGHIGCTSFYPSKNLGAFGDGGAISTDDDALAEQLKMIASHGQSKRYYHDVVGCNSRLDAMQAAILNIKLKHLDEYISARQKAADFYDNAFKSHNQIETPFRSSNNNHVFHQYTLILHDTNRDKLSQYLTEQGVPNMIYYPVPAHRQKMFDAFGGSSYHLPETDWLTERVISLPIHTELDEEQQQFICDKVLSFFNQ